MQLLGNSLKFSPLNATISDGGKNLGTLSESSSSDNNDSALESDDDSPLDDNSSSQEGVVDVDDIFGDKSSAAPKDDLAQAVEKQNKERQDIQPQADNEDTDSATDVEKQQQIDAANAKKKATQAGQQQVKDGNGEVKIEGETEAEKKLRLNRDYTGFKKEDAELLKKLPNGIFNHVAPAIKSRYKVESQLEATTKELTELKKNPGRMPDSWYENADAFTLTPEYKAIADNHSAATWEKNFWEEQLVKIKDKQPFQGFTVVNGQYKPTGPFQPNAQAEVQVQAAYQQAANAIVGLEAQAEAQEKEFKSKYQESVNYYDSPDAKKLWDQLHPDLKPKEEDYAMAIGMMHPYHRNHPVTTKVVAPMLSVMLNQGKMMKAMREEIKRLKLNKSDNTAAGPSSRKTGIVTGGKEKSPKNGSQVIDLDELDAEMRGE